MKIPEHLALSFLVSQLSVQQEYGWAGTGLVLLAGFLPDLDGVTLLAGWRVYRRYHRMLGHGILVTLAGPALLALLGTLGGIGPFWPLWGWLQASLLAHLATDVLFYGWPVQLLWPFSKRAWGFGLVRWNDLVPTLLLYVCSVIALFIPTAAMGAAVAGVGGLA